MFPYFGRKGRSAKLYPKPDFPLVIEPFAGSMGYTLHHRPEYAIGVEKDERVVELWHRMSKATGNEQPPVVGGKTTDLLVKVLSYSEHALLTKEMTITSRMLRDWSAIHKRASRDGKWVTDHVDYRLGSYESCPDVEATWFIDPPYQYANRRGYRFGGKTVDFAKLAEFCRSRKGQVIVCEQLGADWLPFSPLANFSSHRGAISAEVVWYNND